jgi:hypothetical protein
VSSGSTIRSFSRRAQLHEWVNEWVSNLKFQIRNILGPKKSIILQFLWKVIFTVPTKLYYLFCIFLNMNRTLEMYTFGFSLSSESVSILTSEPEVCHDASYPEGITNESTISISFLPVHRFTSLNSENTRRISINFLIAIYIKICREDLILVQNGNITPILHEAQIKLTYNFICCTA